MERQSSIASPPHYHYILSHLSLSVLTDGKAAALARERQQLPIL
jgi:hypothetical protein